MAGLVVKVLVENEAKVDQGQPVLVLEAMKMEVCKQTFFLDCNAYTMNITNRQLIV